MVSVRTEIDDDEQLASDTILYNSRRIRKKLEEDLLITYLHFYYFSIDLINKWTESIIINILAYGMAVR